jgi:hypothetical protein
MTSPGERNAVPGGRPPGIAIAILLGLHGCRDDTDEDMLLVRMGLPGAADDLAHAVYKNVRSLHLSLPSLADHMGNCLWIASDRG